MLLTVVNQEVAIVDLIEVRVCIESLKLLLLPLSLFLLLLFPSFFLSLAAFLLAALELFLAFLALFLSLLLFFFPLLFLLLSILDTFFDPGHPFDVSDFDLLSLIGEEALVKFLTQFALALADFLNLTT